jgi:hypothetical protein
MLKIPPSAMPEVSCVIIDLMNLASKLILSSFFLALCSFYSLPISAQNRLDNTFTLTKNIRLDKLAIGEHGVFFYELRKKALTDNQVVKDFNYIETLSLIRQEHYQKQTFRDRNHVIKIWTSQTKADNAVKVVEINSIYVIDTTVSNGLRLKDTIYCNNYFIQLKNSANNIQYETISRQGVSKYSIANRKVFVNRETILASLLYIDKSKEIKALLEKYGHVQRL